jgi:hypothetical protein
MPIYSYKVPSTGQIIEEFHHMGKAPKTITINDEVCNRDYSSISVPATSGWPLECIASGVNAEQAGELRKEFDRVGVKTEVSKDGNPIYRDAQHRRKALKARGFVDKASFN